MDLALFDDVEETTSLSVGESGCFYQLLAAAGRAEDERLTREAEAILEQTPNELKSADGKHFSIAALLDEPAAHRGRLVTFAGTARRLVRVRVAEELRGDLDIDHYYQVFLSPEDQEDASIAFCTRRLPKGMPVEADNPDEPYAERVRVTGFFMKPWSYLARAADASDPLSGGVQRRIAPLLVGGEVIWTPSKPSEPVDPPGPVSSVEPTTRSEEVLVELGMDLGLFGDVEDGAELTGPQRACLERMLAAAGRAESEQVLLEARMLRRTAPDELRHEDGEQYLAAPLLADPAAHRGRLLILSGTARRTERVEIDDAAAARLGFDHYFRLYVFTADVPDVPVVFAVRSLPSGMLTGDGPQHVYAVHMAGFFAMTWDCPDAPSPDVPSPDVPSPDDDAHPADAPATPGSRQVVPVLVGRQPLWNPHARDLLRLHGVEEIRYAIDGAEVSSSELETLLNVLYWVRGFSVVDVEGWARDDVSPVAIVDDPETHRVELVRLSGRLVERKAYAPLPTVAENLELPAYYRCRVMVEGDGPDDRWPVLIYTPTVPSAWKQDKSHEQDAEVGAVGLFLKVGGNDPETGKPMPVFVAQRIAWHPDTPLGRRQMDVGLLDDVVDRKGLRDVDRECFYQLLAAAGRTEPGELLEQAEKLLADLPAEAKRNGGKELKVVPLFNEAPKQRGRLVVLTGTVKSVVRMRVDEESIRQRFGIDAFYNVFLFPDDSQNNPVVFCVLELPEGMSPGSDPDYSERVRVAGFFMKTWGYPIANPKTSSDDSGSPPKQLAPLLIGRDLELVVEPTPTPDWLAGLIAGGLFVVALLGVWIALWRFSRGDRQFHRQTLSKTYAVESGVSLDEIDLQTAGEVDYDGPNDDRSPGGSPN